VQNENELKQNSHRSITFKFQSNIELLQSPVTQKNEIAFVKQVDDYLFYCLANNNSIVL